MRTSLLPILLIPLLAAACTPTSSTGSGSSSSSGAGGAGGAGVVGWVAVDLINDTQGPYTIYHQGASIVSAIWFGSLDHGVVGLVGANDTFTDGGAILGLSSPTKVAEVTFSGYKVAALGDKTIDIVGFFPTPAGLVAGTTYQEPFLHSTDMGKTFSLDTLGDLLGGGLNGGRQMWISKDSAGRWHALPTLSGGDGSVWFTDKDPSPSTTWTPTWVPFSVPPIPDPLPNGACPESLAGGYFVLDPQKVFWASPDGQTMVYGRGDGFTEPAGVCQSTDGGHSFYPKDFPTPPMPSAMSAPSMVSFADATHGFAARANDLEDGSAYVYTTADAGATWTAGKLPDSVNAPGARVALISGFWAPDGQHAWIVGFAGSDVHALLLKTQDSGKTWTDISAKLAAIPAAQTKMHTGFALDENHIWIGGDHGALFYSPNGGE